MTRPTKDQWLIDMAKLVSTRSTCVRRAVGCVLVNARGHVLATGYNGVARGLPHCNEDNPCAGSDAMTGMDLEACEAIHAEQNALLQCHDVSEIAACYISVSPCVTCTKLLLNTSCQRIVFADPYAHDEVAKRLWRDADRSWEHFQLKRPSMADLLTVPFARGCVVHENVTVGCDRCKIRADHRSGHHKRRPVFGCPLCVEFSQRGDEEPGL